MSTARIFIITKLGKKLNTATLLFLVVNTRE